MNTQGDEYDEGPNKTSDCCRECGESINPDAIYWCYECGAPIDTEVPQP
jgi:transposase